MVQKKDLFKLMGQMALMALAVITGGATTMAMAFQSGGVEVTDVPEAEVTNPINATDTADGSKASFPEQSVTSTEAANKDGVMYEDQYDKLITKIRPSRTPIDTISRQARNGQTIKGMEFKFGSIDYLPVSTTLSSAHTVDASASVNDQPEELTVTNAGIFNRRDIIIVKGVYMTKSGSTYTASTTRTAGAEELKLWVVDRKGNTKVQVIAINGVTSNSKTGIVPSIAKDTKLVRIAKACAELDSQAPGYAIFPKTEEQYMQKFMAQVEQSTIDALTAKRFNITLSDQEEAVLADMRLGMEGAYLFGTIGKWIDPDTQRNVWATRGIWNTPGITDVVYSNNAPASSSDPDLRWSMESLIDLAKNVFTGPAAGKSTKRLVICGSELLATFEKVFVNNHEYIHENKRWGLEFTELTTNFGSFAFVLDEVFDLHGMEKCGMILDVDYLQRYTFEKFGRNVIDLNSQGTRDSKAVVLREISSLVLKAPQNHRRIVCAD